MDFVSNILSQFVGVVLKLPMLHATEINAVVLYVVCIYAPSRKTNQTTKSPKGFLALNLRHSPPAHPKASWQHGGQEGKHEPDVVYPVSDVKAT
jgi:hypothetical protein